MKNNSSSKTIIVVFLVLYFPFLYFGMRNVSSFVQDGLSAGLINYMGAFFNLAALFAIFVQGNFRISKYNKSFAYPLFGWIILVIVNSLLTSDSIGRMLKNFNYSSMWATHFLVYYLVASKSIINEKKIVSVFSVLALLSSFLVVLLFNTRNVVEGGLGFTGGLNSSYFVICLLPWLVLVKKKGLRLALLTVAAVAVFLSMKRTALIVLALQLLFFFLLQGSGKTRRGAFSKIFLTVFSLMVLFYVFNYVSNTYLENGIQARFEMAENDDMGARPYIWGVLLEKYNTSPLFYKLIGHGGDSFMQEGGIELSAHNDYLETLYDFGIIGVALLILFIISLFLKIKKMMHNNKDLGISYLIGVIALVFIMFSSHLLYIHPCQVVFITAILGYAIGVNERNSRIILSKKYEIT